MNQTPSMRSYRLSTFWSLLRSRADDEIKFQFDKTRLPCFSVFGVVHKETAFQRLSFNVAFL